MVHSTLKAAKAQAPCQARRRSTGSVDEEAQRRADQARVAAVRARALGGQRPPQDERRSTTMRRGREPVDGPPARRLGHQPRDGAGQEDAQQQPRHDAGHDPSPPLLGRQVGGEGDHDLAGHRGAADGDRGQAKNHRLGASAQATRATAATQKSRVTSAAARVEVAERDDEQEAGGVADLGGGDDRRGRAGAAVEAARHLVQDGLRVVEVGHHGAGGHRDERRRAPARAPCAWSDAGARRCHRVRLPAARSCGSDVAAAPALGGDAGQRGEDQRARR